MIQEIVYETVVVCKHCKEEITIRLRSSEPDLLTKAPGLKKEAVAQALNQHWYRVHHICAKCGKLIKKGQTTYALKSKINWPIDEVYLEVNTEKYAGAVNVHKTCSSPEDK